MTEVSIIRLTRRLTAKQKFLKRMTGNRNANEKNKLTKGMQLASMTRRKITNNNQSTLRQLTGSLDHNNCSPNRFAKKKLFSRLCQ